MSSLALNPALLKYRGAFSMARMMSKALRPRPDLLVWQWADKRRKLNRKHAKRAGRWRTDVVPFMREPMAMLSARSQVQRIDLMKGAQVAGTETGLNLVGYTIDVNPTSIMFVSPSLTVAKRTSARVQAMIDDDPKNLGKLVRPSRERGAQNSVLEKHFPNGALYFATAKSAANLRSTAVETMVLDELEAYPRDVEEEGDTEGVAEARGDSFGDSFKILAISTPAVDQTSLIRPAYEAGDQRYYFMRCIHAECRRLFHFRKENLAWTAGKPETAHYVCQHCNGRIDQRHKTRLMADGIWIPKFLREDREAMACIEAGDTSALDAHNAEVLRVSYHLPSLYSPLGWLSWVKVAKRWEAAEGIPSKMKVIVNTIFGETWVEAGEAPAWEGVYARRDMTYQMRQVPKDVVFLTGTADPGQDHIEVSVWGWGRRRRRYLVDHFRIDGDINDPATWEQLTAARQRVYLHPSGAALPLRMFGIDRNYHPELVDPWVQEQGDASVVAVLGRDYLDKFNQWTKRKDKPTADTQSYGPRARFAYVIVGSSYGKLDLYGCLNLRTVEGKDMPAGWVSLPSDVPQDYCKQLVSERLTYEEKKGRRTKGKWVGVGVTRHEALDCAVYGRSLANLVGFDRWTDSDWDREERYLAAAAQEAAAIREDLAREAGVPAEEFPFAKVFRNLVLPRGQEDAGDELMDQTGKGPVERRIDVSQKAKVEATERLEVEAPEPAPEPEAPAKPTAYPGARKSWGSRGGSGPRQAGVVGPKREWRSRAERLVAAGGDDDEE